MNERSLEARNLTLWKIFWIIPIRLPVSEISSCKGNGNFWSFTTSVLILYSNLSLTYPKLQTSDRFLEILRLSRKKCEPMDRAPIHDHCIAPWKLWILISRRSRYSLHSSKRFVYNLQPWLSRTTNKRIKLFVYTYLLYLQRYVKKSQCKPSFQIPNKRFHSTPLGAVWKSRSLPRGSGIKSSRSFRATRSLPVQRPATSRELHPLTRFNRFDRGGGRGR